MNKWKKLAIEITLFNFLVITLAILYAFAYPMSLATVHGLTLLILTQLVSICIANCLIDHE